MAGKLDLFLGKCEYLSASVQLGKSCDRGSHTCFLLPSPSLLLLLLLFLLFLLLLFLLLFLLPVLASSPSPSLSSTSSLSHWPSPPYSLLPSTFCNISQLICDLPISQKLSLNPIQSTTSSIFYSHQYFSLEIQSLSDLSIFLSRPSILISPTCFRNMNISEKSSFTCCTAQPKPKKYFKISTIKIPVVCAVSPWEAGVAIFMLYNQSSYLYL